MTNIVYLHKYRPITRIPPAYQEDIRIRFAREVEQRLAMIEAMEGLPKLPGRFIEDARPSDSGDAA